MWSLISFTVNPGFAQGFGRAAGGNDFNVRLRENLGEGNQSGLVGDGNERALNFCHSGTKSRMPPVPSTANKNYFASYLPAPCRCRWRARTVRAPWRSHAAPGFGWCAPASAMFRHPARPIACLSRPRRAVWLRATPRRLLPALSLRIQRFPRLDEIGIGGAHLQLDLAGLIIERRSWTCRTAPSPV